MDPIRSLNEHTDLVAKQMLSDVVKRKQKFDKMEKKLFRWRVLTISISALFLIYLWFFIIRASNYSFSVSTERIFDNQTHLLILLSVGFGFGAIRYFDKKKEKAEKEYHDLRCEIIRKSIELWPQPDKWSHREEVYDMMVKEFDISLYHESK